MLKTSRPSTLLLSTSLVLLVGAVAGCNRYKDSGLENVRKNRGELESCVAELLQRNPAAKGQVVLQFQIAPDGKVNQFGFAKNDTNDEGFKECVKQRAVQWQFPAPPSGKMERFDYPFQVNKQ